MLGSYFSSPCFNISIQKGYPGFQQSVELQSIKWNKFADGWPNLFIENVKQSCAGRDGMLSQSCRSTVTLYFW